MNPSETNTRSERESNVESTRTAAGRGREYVSKGASTLRRGVGSGAVPAIVGGAGVLSGLRALASGERDRGLARLAVGAALLAAAFARRRSAGRGGESDVEETDVVDAGPDVGAVADEAGGVSEEDHAAGEAAAEVADTSPDVEDAGTGIGAEPASDTDADTESAPVDQREVVDTGVGSEDVPEGTGRAAADAGDGAETEEVERLGEAAFDRQSREVPAPQRAFNRGFLAHSAEAFWGISTRDDSVLVSQDYDAVQDRDGVEYVASSEIGGDVRELPIPDTVLDHWDEVAGGGTAVAGGDDVLFVTTDSLAADGLLRVLPAEWGDDLSE